MVLCMGAYLMSPYIIKIEIWGDFVEIKGIPTRIG